MKFRYLLILIWLTMFFFSSCETDSGTWEIIPIPEETYKADVFWSIEIFGSSRYAAPLISEQYCYFPATHIPGGGSNIVKINLDTGSVIWESPRQQYVLTQNLHKIGAYIYKPEDSGYIYVFNDYNGYLAATIMLGENETDAEHYAIKENVPLAVSGHYLFWGNNPDFDGFPRGLMRLDSGEIDFTKAPNEVQLIAPDLVWSKHWQPRISENILCEDGKIYFITRYNTNNSEYPSILTALDIQTNDIVWERNMPLFRGSNSSLVLNGEKIHVIEKNNSCFNKNTGEMIYFNYEETDGPWFLGFSDIALYNNSLYFLTYSYNKDWNEIVSLSADTGGKEWWAYYNGYTSSPQVYGERLYLLNYTGLRVYNTSVNDSTNFIGVDNSFIGDWWSYSFIYKDKFIFVNYPESYGTFYLTAINCK